MAAQTTVMALPKDCFAAPPTSHTSVVLDRTISAQNAWFSDHNRHTRADASAAMTTLTTLTVWPFAVKTGQSPTWATRAPARCAIRGCAC